VSRPDLEFLVSKTTHNGETTIVLARRQAGAAPRPVARLVQVQRDSQSHISVQRIPERWTTPSRDSLARATLEQLYSVVLHQDPQARFHFVDSPGPLDAAQAGLSQAQLLRSLAGRVERKAARDPGTVAWRVVELQPVAPRTFGADAVEVRVIGPEGPMAGLAIHFDRAPHSMCTARTGADGVAHCMLEDTHADGHLHDHAAAVVATFPGELRPDRVLLPTTQVLLGGGGASLPAFARRFPFPATRP
jgi:hypothetical protein